MTVEELGLYSNQGSLVLLSSMVTYYLTLTKIFDLFYLTFFNYKIMDSIATNKIDAKIPKEINCSSTRLSFITVNLPQLLHCTYSIPWVLNC